MILEALRGAIMNSSFQHDIIDKLFEGAYIVDRNRKIIFWNPGAEEITGFKGSEVINSFCYQNILQHVTEDGTNLCHQGCPLSHTLQTGEILEADVFLHHKDGHRVPVSVKTIPFYDANNNITSAVEIFTDSRHRRDAYHENRKLKEQLITDPLTKVPNRSYLDFHLGNIKREVEQFDSTFGILFFDIDHFKQVNDIHGHNIGDKILKMVSQTILVNLRKDDKLGRWGGEEFIAVLKLRTNEELSLVAEKLRLLVERSAYQLSDSNWLRVTVSIGGTLFKNGEEISALIHRADQNMYLSKESGRNKVSVA
jgi:diguanylate cyclase (GGDEF)-like protein/PAS domain S-box-containing protein